MPSLIPELNVVRKNWRKVDLKIALCYPNIYRAGMTGLPIRLLYALFNAREDVVCERFFIPTKNEPLTSLESNQPLKKFDVIAFTLQYEIDYVNVLRMLSEAGVPLKRKERGKDDPLVIAGGPCATENPEPLADYIDMFIIGEVEPILNKLIDGMKQIKTPKEVVDLASLEGVYVPEARNLVRKVWIRRLDDAPHPLAQQVPLVDSKSPYMTIFGKTFNLEVTRGCSRGCRFCLIGFTARPMRPRSLKKLEGILEEGMRYTPVDKVSLIGSALSDFPKLEELCEYIISNNWRIAIPSIRPDAVTEKLARNIVRGKQRRITLAPDGTSQRLRNLIHKGIEEDQIIQAAKILHQNGIKQLKLYYIIGFPTEKSEDIKEMVLLTKKIAEIGFNSIHVSVNPLIPKPHTPFQWEPFPAPTYLRKHLKLIKKELEKHGNIRVSGLNIRRAQIQAFLSLGDRKVGRVIELAARYGASLGAWRKAFKENGISLGHYLRRKNLDEQLPWDFIQIDLNRCSLIKELEKAYSEPLN